MCSSSFLRLTLGLILVFLAIAETEHDLTKTPSVPSSSCSDIRLAQLSAAENVLTRTPGALLSHSFSFAQKIEKKNTPASLSSRLGSIVDLMIVPITELEERARSTNYKLISRSTISSTLEISIYETETSDFTNTSAPLRLRVSDSSTRKRAAIDVVVPKGRAATKLSLPPQHKAQGNGACAGLPATDLPSTPFYGLMQRENDDGDDKNDFLKCIGCVSTLGILAPVVLNVAIGELFAGWCEANDIGNEEECEELAIDVVLALELPVIVASAYMIFEACVESGICSAETRF